MKIDIDSNSPAWISVAGYVRDRVATLTELCTSCVTTDQDRRHAAERIDELRSLLIAPDETRRAAELRTPMASTY